MKKTIDLSVLAKKLEINKENSQKKKASTYENSVAASTLIALVVGSLKI